MSIHLWVFLIVVFPLISTSGIHLISNFLGTALIIGWWLKEDDANFKVKETNCINFQNFDIFFFKMKMRPNTSLITNQKI